MKTVIEPSVIDGIMQELEISDVKKASIRQVGAIVREAEKRTGTEYIHFEMGVPGLPPPAVGVRPSVKLCNVAWHLFTLS